MENNKKELISKTPIKMGIMETSDIGINIDSLPKEIARKIKCLHICRTGTAFYIKNNKYVCKLCGKELNNIDRIIGQHRFAYSLGLLSTKKHLTKSQQKRIRKIKGFNPSRDYLVVSEGRSGTISVLQGEYDHPVSDNNEEIKIIPSMSSVINRIGEDGVKELQRKKIKEDILQSIKNYTKE